MPQRTKLVFISHDSNLTGAPVLLYNLIALVAKTNKYEIEIVLVRGGALQEKFKKLGDVLILKPADYGQNKGLLIRLKAYLSYRNRLKEFYKRVFKAKVVFNNTVVNGNLLPPIQKKGIPIITYIHELDKVFDYFNQNNAASLTLQCSSHLFYPSLAVKNSLVKNHLVSEQKVSYLPYYFNFPHTIEKSSIQSLNAKLSNGKIIPPAKFYVAGMGTANDRKGIDLFVETCIQVLKLRSDICFVWIGDFDDEKIKVTIQELIESEKLNGNLIVTGIVPYSIDNLSPFDLFFLSSKEDPYPLVVLEAAASAVPTLYFINSGGIGEFIKQDAGWGVEKFDTLAAGILIADLMDKPDLLKAKGTCAYDRVMKNHADEKAISDILENTLNNIINK